MASSSHAASIDKAELVSAAHLALYPKRRVDVYALDGGDYVEIHEGLITIFEEQRVKSMLVYRYIWCKHDGAVRAFLDMQDYFILNATQYNTSQERFRFQREKWILGEDILELLRIMPQILRTIGMPRMIIRAPDAAWKKALADIGFKPDPIGAVPDPVARVPLSGVCTLWNRYQFPGQKHSMVKSTAAPLVKK